jgi:hypothetical protein
METKGRVRKDWNVTLKYYQVVGALCITPLSPQRWIHLPDQSSLISKRPSNPLGGGLSKHLPPRASLQNSNNPSKFNRIIIQKPFTKF